ncbi:hypothetical protein [uncultured Sneathia sp.]|uniref:hypothetical protein n=1 Tax=uncultured Sneathia sp. TaxID=278067 RepID=UPI002595A226|nr:hypothetical protein [uncultured Sneathia sp.]
MKKTILLASLVASMTTIAAGTTGSVEFFNKNEHEIESTTDHQFKVKEIGVKTEVKVKDSGLSFGGTFQGKDIVLPLEKYVNDNGETLHAPDSFFNNSNIFIKYELPEMKKVNSYVKAKINPKVERNDKDELSFKAGNVELEGDISYKVADNAKVGLNSKTVFPFEKEYEWQNYGANVTSTHKLYFDAKKINSFKDVNAGLELQHSYDKDSSHAIKYVGLNAKGTYVVSPKLDITGKFNFRYQFNGESEFKDLLDGEKITLDRKDYMHSYELDAKYTGVKDLELTGGAFVQHVFLNETGVDSDEFIAYIKNTDGYKNLKAVYDKNKEEIEKASNEFSDAEKALNTLRDKYKDNEQAKEEFKNVVESENHKQELCDIYTKAVNDLYDGINELIQKESKENEVRELKAKFLKDFSEHPETAANVLNTNYFNDLKALFSNEGQEEFDKLRDKENSSYNDYDSYEVDYTALDDKLKTLDNTYEQTLNNFNTKKQALDDANEKVKDYNDMLEKIDYHTEKSTLLQKEHYINYGVKLGAKYTGIKNLTLKANGVFGAETFIDEISKITLGYVKLDADAKYDYKVTDKFVVSPEFNTTVKFSKIKKDSFDSELVLAPKVSAKYTPIKDKLVITGNLETPIKFSGDKESFGFDNVTIKTGLNIKYTW